MRALLVALLLSGFGLTVQAEETFQVFVDGQYFNSNLQDENRWILWPQSDDFIDLGRQNINAENKNLNIGFKVKSLVDRNLTVILRLSSCSGVALINEGGVVLRIEPMQEGTFELNYAPTQAGNLLCKFSVRVGDEENEISLKGVAQDREGNQ